MPWFTVVYDACVLYPAPLRDFLLQLALADLFRACWTNQIHDEWMRNVLANRPDLSENQLRRTRQLMDRHLSESKVLQAARTHRARLKNPPKSGEEYLTTIEAQSLPQTALFLRKHINLI